MLASATLSFLAWGLVMIHASPEPADAAHACQPTAHPHVLFRLLPQTSRRRACLTAPSTKYPSFGADTLGKNGGTRTKTGVAKGRFPWEPALNLYK